MRSIRCVFEQNDEFNNFSLNLSKNRQNDYFLKKDQLRKNLFRNVFVYLKNTVKTQNLLTNKAISSLLLFWPFEKAKAP